MIFRARVFFVAIQRSHIETLALNVAESSTLKGAAVLKAQYQKLVKLVHPDVCSHPR